ASPEQCLGTKADGRADLYSVGVMMWEALAGKRRPLSETALASTRPGAQSVEIDIAETLPGVPLPLARIVRRALARDPAERFQTARAFELELRKYLLGRAASNGAPALKALITGYFGGEIATVRRAIDEQVGSVRHSIAPEPLSVRMSQPAPSSESPHNIGVTAAPRAPVNRLRQLSTVGLVGVAFAAGALWFSQTSRPAANSAPGLSPTLGAARPAEPASPAPAARAQSATNDPSPGSLQPNLREPALEGDRPAGTPKNRSVRAAHPDAFAAALKTGSVPAVPSVPAVAPAPKLSTPPAAAVLSAKPKGTAAAEPGIDLRQAPSTSTARSLDESHPYGP